MISLILTVFFTAVAILATVGCTRLHQYVQSRRAARLPTPEDLPAPPPTPAEEGADPGASQARALLLPPITVSS